MSNKHLLWSPPALQAASYWSSTSLKANSLINFVLKRLPIKRDNLTCTLIYSVNSAKVRSLPFSDICQHTEDPGRCLDHCQMCLRVSLYSRVKVVLEFPPVPGVAMLYIILIYSKALVCICVASTGILLPRDFST